MPDTSAHGGCEHYSRYRDYVDIAATMIIDLDLEGKVRFANKYACKVLEAKDEEILGKNWFDHFIPQQKRDEAKEIFKKIITVEASEFLEIDGFSVLTSSGKERIISWCNSVLKDPEGNIVGILSSGNDVTDLKRVESALAQSEEKYRGLFLNAQVGLFQTRVSDGKIMSCNENYARWAGYKTPEECCNGLLGKDYYVDPGKRGELLNYLKAHQVINNMELELINKDNKRFWTSVSLKLLPEQNVLEGAMIDITDKKKAEENLKQSENKFREFFQRLPVGALLTYHSNQPFTVNQAFCDMLGYSKEELETKPSYETGKMISHPEDQRKESMYVKQMIAGEIQNYIMEKRFIKKNGDIICGDVASSFVRDDSGNIVMGISSVMEVTDKKIAERALKESQERYSALFERSFDGVYQHDFDGRYLDGNKTLLELTGYSHEEIATLKISDLINEDQWEQAAESAQTIIRQGYEEQLRRYKIRTKNNGIRDIESRGALIYRDGEPYAIQGVVRDITEQKRYEDRLRFQGMILDQITDLITVTDMAGNITYINQAERNALKRELDEVIGRSVHIFGEDASVGATQNEIIENTIVKGSWQGIVANIDRDGGKRLLDTRTFTVKDGAGRPVAMCGISTDITEKKKLEEQLQQAQKMEAVGTLAGGIAHDFNNLLGIILGNAEMAKFAYNDKRPVGYHVEQIIEACLRGESVIRQLLYFSRQTKQIKFSLTLPPLIKEALKLLRSIIPVNVDICQRYKNENVMALVDPTQIHQIIINLCTNAYHAMPEGGGIIDVAHDTVVINSKNRQLYENLNPGRYIRLRISDTGDGIAAENLDRIFDPYFTTKEGGSGTGLGLSVVHGIVKDCDGAITVSSEPMKGTTFTILIPVAGVDRDEAMPTDKTEVPKGNEKVLFVDDEESLALIGREMLGKLGYRAKSVTSSAKALKMIVSDPNQFDMVITDMAMPEMTGPELAGEIFRIRPDIPMILCTGYSEHMEEEKAIKMGFKAFLKKPVKIGLLANTLRKVLDEK